MIRIIAVLILAALGLSGPARACGAATGSTFCAEAWAAQPGGGTRGRDGAGNQAGAWPDNSGADPPFGGEGIHVEGAVAVDGPMPDDDGEL